jgi:hypothetical protein
VQALAKNIVELASQGERDPERMKLLALLALKSARINPARDLAGAVS